MLRIAMLSYHTCPLAILGGKDTGGMNVYVRDLTRELGRLGIHVDVFTRSQDEHVPHVVHELGYGNRVVHVTAGPEVPVAKQNPSGLHTGVCGRHQIVCGRKGHPIRSYPQPLLDVRPGGGIALGCLGRHADCAYVPHTG